MATRHAGVLHFSAGGFEPSQARARCARTMAEGRRVMVEFFAVHTHADGETFAGVPSEVADCFEPALYACADDAEAAAESLAFEWPEYEFSVECVRVSRRVERDVYAHAFAA